MRALIIIILLVAVLVFAGWITLTNPDGDPTIRVNSDKVKQDTSTILDKSKQAIDNFKENTDGDAVAE